MRRPRRQPRTPGVGVDDTTASVPGIPAEPEEAVTSGQDLSDVSTVEFAMVYQAEKPLLVRYLMQGGAAFHDAEAAAQRALEDLYQQWGTVRSPRSWLRTVAPRKLSQGKVARRKLARRGLTEIPLEDHDLPGISPDPAAIDSLQEDAVISAILGLPGLQGKVFALFFDQFETSEIAEILHISQASVRQHLARARARLKKLPEFAKHSPTARDSTRRRSERGLNG